MNDDDEIIPHDYMAVISNALKRKRKLSAVKGVQTGEFSSSMFKGPSVPWICNQCQSSNLADDSVCAVCDQLCDSLLEKFGFTEEQDKMWKNNE